MFTRTQSEHFRRKQKVLYLQARSKSALWLRPTYLYRARASQTMSKKRSRETTTVVSLLYNSKGIPQVVSTFSWIKSLVTFAWSNPPVSLDSYSALDGIRQSFELVASDGKSSTEDSSLITSNTLRLIYEIRTLNNMFHSDLKMSMIYQKQESSSEETNYDRF